VENNVTNHTYICKHTHTHKYTQKCAQCRSTATSCTDHSIVKVNEVGQSTVISGCSSADGVLQDDVVTAQCCQNGMHILWSASPIHLVQLHTKVRPPNTMHMLKIKAPVFHTTYTATAEWLDLYSIYCGRLVVNKRKTHLCTNWNSFALEGAKTKHANLYSDLQS